MLRIRVKGMRLTMREQAARGYGITYRWEDFNPLETGAMRGQDEDKPIGKVASIPAPLACYRLSA